MGRFLDYPRGSGENVPNATATVDGFMSAADKAKLDALTPGSSGTLYFGARPGSNFPPILLVLPTTQVGDVLVSAYSLDGSDFTANFEPTISNANQIRQTSGALNTGSPIIFTLKRPG